MELARAGKRADIRALGGKGARLAEMTSAGFAVPAAFCVTAEALREIASTAAVREAIAAGDFHAIRAAIASTELPDQLAREIVASYERLGRPRVAVRSSGVAEDSASQSFAGQHDTFLDVHGDDAVFAAVKSCWASLWSERVRSYGHHAEPAMAVVVQTMVDADCAGVLFTVDPVEGRERVVIEACWGLGEGLVSARVPSDTFVLDRQSLEIVDRQVRYKLTKCAASTPGSVTTVSVDPAKRDVP
ncbi:MAG TPA: PEP/pyruvate-binding domain-containing protein, partial [Kofleriaceae bacterium]|nr:PEP/pyruvate-binding domain-containing protein [Kofleriaceae bacterium]